MPRKRITSASGRSILVIDDNEEYLDACVRMLARDGHEVLTASCGRDGLAILRSRRVDLVLVDYFMPAMTGEQFVLELRHFDPYVQVILQTGYSTERPPREMLRRLDIQGYHDKSEGPEKLNLWIDVGLRSASAVQQMTRSRLGMSYVLSATPELHKIQPVDDLLRGVLLQIVGLLGAVDSFLAVTSEPVDLAPSDVFVALAKGDGPMRIRAGTGRYDAREGPEHDLSPAALEKTGTVLPLRVGDTTLGMIYVDRRLDRRDDEMLTLFANQVAVAIHNASLYELAAVDPLTRVYSRRFFEHALLRELGRGYREGTPVTLLLVDVDGMKTLNDRGGHLCGDRALQEVGSLLRRATRAADVVGRYGGDEFGVVLPGSDGAGAEIVARRIIEMTAGVSVMGTAGPMPVRLTVGTGVLGAELATDAQASARGRPKSAHYFQQMARKLIAAADTSLYAGKQAGRGRAFPSTAERWRQEGSLSPPKVDGSSSSDFGLPLVDVR